MNIRSTSNEPLPNRGSLHVSSFALALASVLLLSGCGGGGSGGDAEPASNVNTGTNPDTAMNPNTSLPSPNGNTVADTISPDEFVWSQTYTGTVNFPLRTEIVSNGKILLLQSNDETDRTVVDAIDGQTGEKLWRLEDTQNNCTPTSFGENLMVLQADSDTEFGGNDRSNDLLLVNAQTGELLDRWEPASDDLGACSAPLQVTADNTLVHTYYNIQRGFTINDNTIELLWEHEFNNSDAFSTGRELSVGSQAVVVGNNLYIFGRDITDSGVKQFSVYQLNTQTGVVVDRFPTLMTEDTQMFAAGPFHLAIIEQLFGIFGSQEMQLNSTPTVDSTQSMNLVWERVFAREEDTIKNVIGRQTAYTDSNSFGIVGLKSIFEPVIVEFSLDTGATNTILPINGSLFTDPLVKLQNGVYVVAPSVFSRETDDDPMVKGVSADTAKQWGFARTDEFEALPTIHLLDNDRLVMVVPLTDFENSLGAHTEWKVVAIDTPR